MTHTCPNCQYSWSDEDDELDRAVRQDASAHVPEVALRIRDLTEQPDETIRIPIERIQ